MWKFARKWKQKSMKLSMFELLLSLIRTRSFREKESSSSFLHSKVATLLYYVTCHTQWAYYYLLLLLYYIMSRVTHSEPGLPMIQLSSWHFHPQSLSSFFRNFHEQSTRLRGSQCGRNLYLLLHHVTSLLTEKRTLKASFFSRKATQKGGKG